MKDVIITVTGMHRLPDMDEDYIELMTDGLYCRDKTGKITLSYMESEMTGFEGTQTTFYVDESSVVMERSGAVSSRMIFEEGRKHHFVYDTPYGAMTMGVETRNIENNLGDNGGLLLIDYAIDMNNSALSQNSFKISVKEV